MRVKRIISLLMAALGSISNSMAAEGVKKGGKVSSSSALHTKRGAQRLKHQGGESKKGGANKQVNAVSKVKDKALNQSISGKKDVVWTKSEADISAKKEGWSTKRIVGTAVGSLGGAALIGAGIAAIVREICERNKKLKVEIKKPLIISETKNQNSEYSIDEKLKNENLEAFEKSITSYKNKRDGLINCKSICIEPFKFCLSDSDNPVERFMFEAIIANKDEKHGFGYDDKKLANYYLVVDKDVWSFIKSTYEAGYWRDHNRIGAKFAFRDFSYLEYDKVFSNWAENLAEKQKYEGKEKEKENFKQRILGQLNLSSRKQQISGHKNLVFGIGLSIKFSFDEWNDFIGEYNDRVCAYYLE